MGSKKTAQNLVFEGLTFVSLENIFNCKLFSIHLVCYLYIIHSYIAFQCYLDSRQVYKYKSLPGDQKEYFSFIQSNNLKLKNRRASYYT